MLPLITRSFLSASLLLFGLTVLPVSAASDPLLQGSIEKARLTASVKPTTEMVMAKVDEAARLVQELGPDAFPRFKGLDSDFIYAGTYIWVHSAKTGKMLMHPMIPGLEGQNVLYMKDKTGKMMFMEFNRMALEHGSGWVDYLWPKPGEDKPSRKVSYVKLVQYGDERYVVGSGVYDISLEEIAKFNH